MSSPPRGSTRRTSRANEAEALVAEELGTAPIGGDRLIVDDGTGPRPWPNGSTRAATGRTRHEPPADRLQGADRRADGGAGTRRQLRRRAGRPRRRLHPSVHRGSADRDGGQAFRRPGRPPRRRRRPGCRRPSRCGGSNRAAASSSRTSTPRCGWTRSSPTARCSATRTGRCACRLPADAQPFRIGIVDAP